MKNRAFHNFQTVLLCLKRYPSFSVASRVVKMAMDRWTMIVWTQINGIFQSWMFLRRSVQVYRLMCENPWVSHCFYMVRMDNQQSFTFVFDGNSWLCNCPRDIEVCWSKSNYKWRFHLRQRIKHKQMSLPVSAWLIRFTRAFVLFYSQGRSCKPIKYQKKILEGT